MLGAHVGASKDGNVRRGVLGALLGVGVGGAGVGEDPVKAAGKTLNQTAATSHQLIKNIMLDHELLTAKVFFRIIMDGELLLSWRRLDDPKLFFKAK